jgi:hypothetical protein
MKIILKRSPQHWLLYWKPLQGQIGQAEFEAYYCRATKTLALWT